MSDKKPRTTQQILNNSFMYMVVDPVKEGLDNLNSPSFSPMRALFTGFMKKEQGKVMLVGETYEDAILNLTEKNESLNAKLSNVANKQAGIVIFQKEVEDNIQKSSTEKDKQFWISQGIKNQEEAQLLKEEKSKYLQEKVSIYESFDVAKRESHKVIGQTGALPPQAADTIHQAVNKANEYIQQDRDNSLDIDTRIEFNQMRIEQQRKKKAQYETTTEAVPKSVEDKAASSINEARQLVENPKEDYSKDFEQLFLRNKPTAPEDPFQKPENQWWLWRGK